MRAASFQVECCFICRFDFVVGNARGANRQRRHGNAGRIGSHRVAEREGIILDDLRQQTTRQRRRFEISPEIDRLDLFFAGEWLEFLICSRLAIYLLDAPIL